MERRSFFKILSSVSAGVAASSCTRKTDALIPVLVPDHEMVPSEEQWHPAVCNECGAGCGTIVRVMKGERLIERQGRQFREPVACIKKIEGNPLDPVSGGRLCARGQAAVQSLYNPDRVSGPLRRKGPRGSAEFVAVSWDDAIDAVAVLLEKQRSADPAKILFLTGPAAGNKAETVQNFLSAMNAPPPVSCAFNDMSIERKASQTVFGWNGVPVYDIARAKYVLGIGADFLGGWASPVYYARQYGAFRQGRPGVRGRFVHAESRMSLTAANADEWLPLQPGSEPQFLTALLRLLLDTKAAQNSQQFPVSMLAAIRSADLTALTKTCGIDVRRLQRVAHELSESDAPVVLAGASSVHTNSLAAVTASHYVNLLLGAVGRAGGVSPPNPEYSTAPHAGYVAARLASSKLLFLDGQNPVYTLPSSAGVRQALEKQDTIVSFGPFIDDSAPYADWILPAHHFLETASAVIPAVSPGPAITVSTPFIRPLYDTRSLEQTIAQIAKKMGMDFAPVTPESYLKSLMNGDENWEQVVRQGGFWPNAASEREPPKSTGQPHETGITAESAAFQGDPKQFPMYFQPYLSLQYHDGSGANLPWMQELPDPASSAMWNVPVEIDPQTAAQMKVSTGDWVRVESPAAALEAPAYVHPAAIPGVISMAIGEGHTHYGRYASGRGANPISILAAAWEPVTGTLASGATRVRLARLEKPRGEFIQFSPRDREQGPWGYR